MSQFDTMPRGLFEPDSCRKVCEDLVGILAEILWVGIKNMKDDEN